MAVDFRDLRRRWTPPHTRLLLWGAGELVGEITIVDELADEELHAAWRAIDSRLPHLTGGLRVEPHPQGHAARRTQLLELAERLQPLRPLSERDLSVSVPDVDILVFVTSGRTS